MARLTAMGFLAVGLIGFLVKVIFIPINQVRPCDVRRGHLGVASRASCAVGLG